MGDAARDRWFDRIGLVNLAAWYPPGTRFLTGGAFYPERIAVVTSVESEPALPGLRAPGAPPPPPGPLRLFVRYYYEDDPNQVSHRSPARVLSRVIVPDQGQGNANENMNENMNVNGGGGKRRKSQRRQKSQKKHRKQKQQRRRTQNR